MRFPPLAALLLLLAQEGHAQTIVVDNAACRALTVAHQPADGVAYAPGVDARGRAVAPANLNAPAPPVLAPSFTFDLGVDLRPYLPAGSPLFQPRLDVGRVTVGPTGAVLFNGQPLPQQDLAALAAACRRASQR
jgi:hypothetical protein